MSCLNYRSIILCSKQSVIYIRYNANCNDIIHTEPEVPYSVSVQAFTVVGGGNSSTAIVFTLEGGMSIMTSTEIALAE